MHYLKAKNQKQSKGPPMEKVIEEKITLKNKQNKNVHKHIYVIP